MSTPQHPTTPDARTPTRMTPWERADHLEELTLRAEHEVRARRFRDAVERQRRLLAAERAELVRRRFDREKPHVDSAGMTFSTPANAR